MEIYTINTNTGAGGGSPRRCRGSPFTTKAALPLLPLRGHRSAVPMPPAAPLLEEPELEHERREEVHAHGGREDGVQVVAHLHVGVNLVAVQVEDPVQQDRGEAQDHSRQGASPLLRGVRGRGRGVRYLVRRRGDRVCGSPGGRRRRRGGGGAAGASASSQGKAPAGPAARKVKSAPGA